MKYFTKEWFADTILADMCFQVKKSSKAGKFSEKYYLSLYNTQKKWFVRSEKIIAKHNKTQFDLQASEAAFEASHKENLEYIKANLPAEILDKVVDLRVLALGSATPEISDEITRFCGKINRRCEKVTEEYENQLDAVGEKLGWEKINMLEKLSNSAIELCQEESESFAFATSAEYTGVPCRVDLMGAKVIQCDEGLVGSAVAHYELLPAENGRLVFSALCQKLDGTLLEFSAEMDDLEVI